MHTETTRPRSLSPCESPASQYPGAPGSLPPVFFGLLAAFFDFSLLFECRMPLSGYPFHSAVGDDSVLVGRSPWTARDAPVPLPDAEAGASARARGPALHDFAG